MTKTDRQEALLAEASVLLADDWSTKQVQVTSLVPDGSSRKFYRIWGEGAERSYICILPPNGETAGFAEAEAFYHIGTHLGRCELSVPKIYGMAPSGMVVCEDLGNTRLYEARHQEEAISKRVIALYENTVCELARMQVCGGKHFDTSWCWDTPCYDKELMLKWESGYFLRALCQDFLEIKIDYEAVTENFHQLAERAAKAPATFFQHRDFQSRNIMVLDDKVCFIDFQGGRKGPLAYDLASLMLDPYVALPQDLCEHLMEVYLEALNRYVQYDSKQFRYEYQVLALQRSLQILGAFAFLSQVKEKPFFSQFILPALKSFEKQLREADEKLPALHELVAQCLYLVEEQ
ncbi:MAG: aminoglycoside phosphotransferase [Desulfobulbus propionicus]|nr:MAG: aminoglycoside phosphotransferase [Desulfobulbus propionicus]